MPFYVPEALEKWERYPYWAEPIPMQDIIGSAPGTLTLAFRFSGTENTCTKVVFKVRVSILHKGARNLLCSPSPPPPAPINENFKGDFFLTLNWRGRKILIVRYAPNFSTRVYLQLHASRPNLVKSFIATRKQVKEVLNYSFTGINNLVSRTLTLQG